MKRHSAGICRGQKALDDAIAQVKIWRKQLATLPLSQDMLNFQSGRTLDFSLHKPYNFDWDQKSVNSKTYKD